MKAIVYTKYGLLDVLKIEEIQKSTSSDDDILVAIHAVSVNYSDWSFVSGKPCFVRLYQGLLKSKKLKF
jgi:NADPH:quinone reductase-like Zn-dependent oxidoreductase